MRKVMIEEDSSQPSVGRSEEWPEGQLLKLRVGNRCYLRFRQQPEKDHRSSLCRRGYCHIEVYSLVFANKPSLPQTVHSPKTQKQHTRLMELN